MKPKWLFLKAVWLTGCVRGSMCACVCVCVRARARVYLCVGARGCEVASLVDWNIHKLYVVRLPKI